jgi:hypothetical protein
MTYLITLLGYGLFALSTLCFVLVLLGQDAKHKKALETRIGDHASYITLRLREGLCRIMNLPNRVSLRKAKRLARAVIRGID